MNTEVYRFKVGNFECMAVSDGTHVYTPPIFPPPATFLFVNAPRERLEHVLREHDLQPEQWIEWISPYICLVVNTGEHRVMVDTGADGLSPNTGKLLQNLQAEGISPEDIDTVISRTAIRTISVGTPMPRVSQFSPTHTTLCGRTSGSFGRQSLT